MGHVSSLPYMVMTPRGRVDGGKQVEMSYRSLESFPESVEWSMYDVAITM